MATTIASNVRWTSGAPAIYLTFSYDKYRNGRDMLYKLYVNVSSVSGASSFGYPINVQISLDGTTVVTRQIKAASPSKWTTALSYATPYFTVPNKTSGTTTVKFRVYSGMGSTRDQSNTYQLAIDPALSTITATDADIESATVISLVRANPEFVHTLSYKFDGQTDFTTLVENLDGTVFGWTIPASTYAMIPNVRSINCTLRCETFSGETSLGIDETTIVCTASADRCAPLISGTVIDTNTVSTALTGDNTRLVRYVSNALATITATARNGSTITSKAVNGKAISGTNITISKVETGTFVFTATDSRGLTATVTVENVLLPYIPLSIVAQFARVTPTNNEIAVAFNGNVFNGYYDAANKKQNALNVQVRWKVNGADTWGSWHDVSFTRSGETFVSGTAGEYVVLGNEFNYINAFDFQIQAIDNVSSGGIIGTSYRTVSKGIPVFDWGEEDFNFNCDLMQYEQPLFPLSIANGGTGVATIEEAREVLGGVDFVVAEGDSGIWHYRKWNSGKAECWGTTTLTTPASRSWGSIYISGNSSGGQYSQAIDYPFEFAEIPTVFSTPAITNQEYSFFVLYEGTKTHCPQYQAFRGATATNLLWGASMYVVGEWK